MIKDLKQSIALEIAKTNATLMTIRPYIEARELKIIKAKRAVRSDNNTHNTTETDGVNFNNVKNSMLFCRAMRATDSDFRKEFGGDNKADVQRIREILSSDSSVTKKDSDMARLLAEGAVMWRKVITDEQKKTIRARFESWKKRREENAMPLPLDNDNDSNVESETE